MKTQLTLQLLQKRSKTPTAVCTAAELTAPVAVVELAPQQWLLWTLQHISVLGTSEVIKKCYG